MLEYALPLNEVVFDFYDRLKSATRGYASFDYQLSDYKTGDLVKMSILVNSEPVDALSTIVHRERAENARAGHVRTAERFDSAPFVQNSIQAALGGKIIARETIAALRKDVTAKCYGGDVSRKRKLLDKQKKAKENASVRQGRYSPGRVYFRAQNGRLGASPLVFSRWAGIFAFLDRWPDAIRAW